MDHKGITEIVAVRTAKKAGPAMTDLHYFIVANAFSANEALHLAENWTEDNYGKPTAVFFPYSTLALESGSRVRDMPDFVFLDGSDLTLDIGVRNARYARS